MPKEKAFTDFIREHQGLLLNVTSLYTDHKHDQEDLLYEEVYLLWKYFDSFRNESNKYVDVQSGPEYNHHPFKTKEKKTGCDFIAKFVFKETELTNESHEERLRLLNAHLQE